MQVCCWFSSEFNDWLRDFAAESGISKSQVLVRAVLVARNVALGDYTASNRKRLELLRELDPQFTDAWQRPLPGERELAERRAANG